MTFAVESQSAAIGGVVTVAVMTGMLLRRRRRRSDLLFAIYCVVLVLWFLAIFLRTAFSQDDTWLRVELAFGALVPAATIHLFADLMPWSQPRSRRLMSWAYPLSGLMAVIALSPLGSLPPVQLGIGVTIGLVILVASRLLMVAGDVAKGTVEYARRRYLAIGASLVTILAIAGETRLVPGTATAMSHLTVMLYVFFLSQVILRDRLLDLNEFIGRMTVLGILAVAFAGISALLISLLGNNPSSRLFHSVVGVIIVLTLYEPLKDRLESKVAELFFRERHRFVQLLEDLRRRMQHGVLEPSRMSRIVVDALYDGRRATHVAVYMLEAMGHGFTLEAFRGPEPAGRVSANDHPALWQAIQQNRTALLTEQLSKITDEDQESSKRDLIDALRAVSADLLLPFVSGETVLGFLALRDDRSAEPYSTAEIAQLMKIAETAATVIWNSKLAEKLRERERLAAVGAMAAGLAHEIRNPLGAIKGAAEYLDPNRFAKDDQGEFLQVIVEETNRLNSVVSQFLDYARPFRANMQPTHMNEVIKKTSKLLEAQKPERPCTLELDLDEELPAIQADGEQMKQVILNLVLNGLDASRSGTEPIVIATRHLPERACIELRVRDRGCGIPAEDLERIFIPFFTTKQNGTGLGLAVCHRIVMNHGGTIHPESRVGVGTEFVIQLPVQQKDYAYTTGNFSRPPRGASVSRTEEPTPEGA